MDIELALIICKEGKNREKVALAATRCGLSVICCSNLHDARVLLVQEDFRIVLCEDFLPDGDFRMVMREVTLTTGHAPLIIVLSENLEWGAYLKGLATGVFDYILWPTSLMESERIVRCALGESARGTIAAGMAA